MKTQKKILQLDNRVISCEHKSTIFLLTQNLDMNANIAANNAPIKGKNTSRGVKKHD
jgi:hypothetical protein